MKISKISVKNYRALDDITINLNENMNVIYGVNGIGKSSILYAVNDVITLLLRGNISKVPNIFKDRIRNNDLPSEIILTFSDNSYVRIVSPQENSNAVRIEHSEKRFDKDFILSRFIPNLVDLKIEAIQEGENINFKVVNQPMVAYTRGIKDYHDFKNTFEALENIENQKARFNHTYRDKTLENIRKAVSLITNELTELAIDREREGNPLCAKKFGKYISIDSQLSSGEASVIALIGQIALDASSKTSNDHIVIIDEIDNSLHPQWQIKICKTLRQVFPNIQFIMSSHSPFIWAGLDKNEIIWLDRDNRGNVIQKDVDFAKGGSLENIITNFFKTDNYDADFSEEIRKIELAIDSRDKNQANILIDNLIIHYGNLPIISQFKFKMRMLGL